MIPYLVEVEYGPDDLEYRVLDAVTGNPWRTRMTVAEAATALGIDPATVRQAIAAGRIQATKRGRDWWIVRSEIERYAAKRKAAPPR